jgi:3-phenylpropionate/trans-cinnamate dioxygenase ferredoxin component
MEPNFVPVAKTGDIREGDLAAFEVGGTKVSIANASGTFYAFDDVCTHRQCSLSEGELDGKAVECPCHGSRFDVATGAVLNPPADQPLKTYPIRIEGDVIAVQA